MADDALYMDEDLQDGKASLSSVSSLQNAAGISCDSSIQSNA